MIDAMGWFIVVMGVVWLVFLVWAVVTRDHAPQQDLEPVEPIDPARMLPDETAAGVAVRHLDGVPWHLARMPRPGHNCWPQTSGLQDIDQIDRCPCGAIRLDGGPWLERNTRRPEREG